MIKDVDRTIRAERHGRHNGRQASLSQVFFTHVSGIVRIYRFIVTGYDISPFWFARSRHGLIRSALRSRVVGTASSWCCLEFRSSYRCKREDAVMTAVSRRILIADDYPNAALSMARRLIVAGYEVETASDGFQAIEAAEKFRPDIVLLDISMPKLNGYETARRIRAQAWGLEMAIVALTGWDEEEDRQRSRDAGFDAHLVKPVGEKALAQLLATLPPTKAAACASQQVCSSPNRNGASILRSTCR
jgi:CheY-like chemotaxis protein